MMKNREINTNILQERIDSKFYLERYLYMANLRRFTFKAILCMDAIIKEKISADHLLYVSLKYTKTCDVIINLLLRWKIMIELAMDLLVERAKKAKKWKPVPDAPRAKQVQLKQIYLKDSTIYPVLELYELFRDIEKLDKVREHEFRKGVNLKVFYRDKDVNINLDKLKEYSEILERFISYLK